MIARVYNWHKRCRQNSRSSPFLIGIERPQQRRQAHTPQPRASQRAAAVFVSNANVLTVAEWRVNPNVR